MNKKTNETGFTLIELLLVVVIIGVLLAVIVPRAWRANVDAKYGVVRQNCTELAAFANQWAEEMIEAQNDQSTSMLSAYLNTLTRGYGGLEQGNYFKDPNAQWIGHSESSSWNDRNPDRATAVVTGRYITDDDFQNDDSTSPESSVEGTIPPERIPRNPFTGSSIFREYPGNDNVVPGSIAAGRARDGDYGYYALIFQGTDSQAPDSTDSGVGNHHPEFFHAGMHVDLEGLRNGIFMARLSVGS